MKFKSYIYLCLLTCFVIIMGVWTTGDKLYIVRTPAVIPFGIILIVLFLFAGLLERLFPKCDICKGYGAVSQKRGHKLINLFFVGSLGERCLKCNGSGVVNIHRLYIEFIKKNKGTK